MSFSGKGEPIHALGPLSFRVAAGEFVSFVGPSGCGKTTLARTMANINRNFEGSLTVGADGDGVVISTVFQDYGVFPWKTAAENLEFEEAARLRDEVKRLEAVELAVADDPLARQSAVEEAADAAVRSSGRSTAGRAGQRGGNKRRR